MGEEKGWTIKSCPQMAASGLSRLYCPHSISPFQGYFANPPIYPRLHINNILQW